MRPTPISKSAVFTARQPLPVQIARSQAFTLIELLVVIAIIAILASLLVPVLNKAKGTSQSVNCLNNLRQLQLAWQMYHEDNNDKLVPNEMSGMRLQPGSWTLGDPVKDTAVSNLQAGVLFPYIHSTEVYRCPADKSTVGNQRGGMPRTRHYSMSCYINGKSPDTDLVSVQKYVLQTASQIAIVQPYSAQTFVFIHEADFSMWGGWYYLPLRWDWVDFPANHQNGQNLSFADGHVEHWRWQDPNTLRASNLQQMGQNFARDNRDLARLFMATPAMAWWAR